MIGRRFSSWMIQRPATAIYSSCRCRDQAALPTLNPAPAHEEGAWTKLRRHPAMAALIYAEAEAASHQAHGQAPRGDDDPQRPGPGAWLTGGTDQPVRNGDGRFHAEQRRQAVRTADAGSIAGSGASPQDEVRAASSGLRVRLVSNVVSFAWVRGRPPRPIR